MQSSVQRIAELYASAGCRDQFLGRFCDEPHRWTIGMQDETFTWLDDKLQ